VIWDALVEVMGTSPGGLERGRWNAAVASLKDSGATPDTIRAAARAYRTMPTYADCAMTPTAIASNYTILVGAGNRNGNGDKTAAARAWVTNGGYAYGDHIIIEELAKRGVDGPQRSELVALALQLQEARP
jgi:hypothetical protein